MKNKTENQKLDHKAANFDFPVSSF